MQNTSIHTCKHLYVWIKCTDITYIQTQDVVSKYQHNPQNCSAKSWYQTHEVGNDSGCDKNCSRCPETRHTRGLARARQNWTESKYRNHPDISGPPLQLAVWCCLKYIRPGAVLCFRWLRIMRDIKEQWPERQLQKLPFTQDHFRDLVYAGTERLSRLFSNTMCCMPVEAWPNVLKPTLVKIQKTSRRPLGHSSLNCYHHQKGIYRQDKEFNSCDMCRQSFLTA